MNLTLKNSDLTNVITEASRFTSNKALTPLLSGIFLQAKSDRLEVRSSTGQVLYKATVPAEVTVDGECVVPAGLALSVLKSLNSTDVTLDLQPERLLVKQGKSLFEIALLTGGEFPQFSPTTDRKQFVLPTEAFSKACRRVLVAASADETKPVLTSVLFELKQPNALVTTDGFRLYRSGVDLALDEDWKVLLPAKVLRDFLGVIEKKSLATLPCWMGKDTTEVTFELPDCSLQMSTVIGDFPDFRSIIPQACAFSLTVDREDLMQSLKQAMIFAKELSSIVVFQMDGEELVVASQSSVQGKSRSPVPVHHKEGDPVKFACNGRYVLDFLSSLDSPDVVLKGNDPLKPIIFTVPEDEGLLYLVMPFKLPDDTMM